MQIIKVGTLHNIVGTHIIFTLDYQINVAYEIEVVLGILAKINKRSLWNQRSLVIFD